MSTPTSTLTPDAAAAAAALATTLSAITAADVTFRKVQGTALEALADSYVLFFHAGIAAVVACGVSVAADADAAAVGKAVREARDSIAADAVGDAASLRDLLASLTGVGAKNGARWSRAASVAMNIGKADKTGAKVTDVRKFVTLHLDTDTRIGIGELATWCKTDRTAALTPAVKPAVETDAAAAAAGAAAAAAVVAAGGSAADAAAAAGVAAAAAAAPATPAAPAGAVSLTQAVEMMHRGAADAALEAVIVAAPIDIALLSDDSAAALLLALLASVEMARRADAAVAAPADAGVAALAALTAAGK